MGDFDFGNGGPGVPYHKTSTETARELAANGFRGGRSRGVPDGRVDEVRVIFDERRPSGYPSHMRSFFMWPSSSDKWRYGPRTVVAVDPSRVTSKCVAADLALLEWAVNDAGGPEEVRELADRYWRTAVPGPLSRVDAAAPRFDEAELFCEAPVPASALSIR
jgi:hypothetical protein